MSMVDSKCQYQACGKDIKVRSADLKRGWGKFCSKSCKAKKQTSRTGVRGGFTDDYFDFDDRHPLDIDQ